MPDWSKDVILVDQRLERSPMRRRAAGLIVTWTKGSRRSVYEGVPEELALQLCQRAVGDRDILTQL
jgi:membrane-bound inhibitor of C-type lysozyme